MERSQSPLAIYSSTGPLEHQRRPGITLYIQIRSPQIFLRTRQQSRSRWRAASYGTWRSIFTNVTANFLTLSIGWQSRERMGDGACIAHSRRGRINASYKRWKILGVKSRSQCCYSHAGSTDGRAVTRLGRRSREFYQILVTDRSLSERRHLLSCSLNR